MNHTTLLIGGDMAPTQTNYTFFEDGNIKAIITDDLLSIIYSADYRIFNLESPLTDVIKPIIKDGLNLIAPSRTIKGIKVLNPSLIGLANNHIMDHDDQGLFSTMDLLKSNMIEHIGAGKDLESAAMPFVLEKDGIKIGIYACAENEFSIAKPDKAGANPFDPLESPDHIVNLKSKCDYVIVLHHGGKEYYRYPSPNLQKVCRKMVEKGADLVICQHTHCIGSYEKHMDSVIVYGQGNFLFDRVYNELSATGLLIQAVFGDQMTVDFIPITKNRNGVSLPSPDDSRSILDSFHERSGNLKQPGFIVAEYEKFILTNGRYYLGTSAGLGRVLLKIDTKLDGIFTDFIFSSKKLNRLQNFIECEAHRELFLNYLDIKRIKKA